MPDSKPLFVIVRDIDHVLFEGNASAVSATNEAGTFDVLPMHSNFISVISDKVSIHQPSGAVKDIPITSAVMKVAEGNVSIYLGVEIL